MSEPQGCPELEEADWEEGSLNDMKWKTLQLIHIYTLTHEILGKGDAMESTVRLADRCGLGKEFRQYLTERK